MVKSLGKHPLAAEELHDGKLPGACGPRAAPQGGEAPGEILRDPGLLGRLGRLGPARPVNAMGDLHRKNDGKSMKTIGFTMI